MHAFGAGLGCVNGYYTGENRAWVKEETGLQITQFKTAKWIPTPGRNDNNRHPGLDPGSIFLSMYQKSK
jgi:hypothetical protein